MLESLIRNALNLHECLSCTFSQVSFKEKTLIYFWYWYKASCNQTTNEHWKDWKFSKIWEQNADFCGIFSSELKLYRSLATWISIFPTDFASKVSILLDKLWFLAFCINLANKNDEAEIPAAMVRVALKIGWTHMWFA